MQSRSSLLVSVAVLFAVAAAGCSNQMGGAATPADTRAADEAAIRAKDGTYEQGVAAKDLDKILALYTDDAVLFAPKAPAAIGKAAIRAGWQGLLGAPGVKMTFKSTSVDVGRSGDLAVQRATFQVETTDKDGKPNTETGQAVVVWSKQADGAWKVIADTNADDK
jgi:uncharacterized protein (TIGR02246 family)